MGRGVLQRGDSCPNHLPSQASAPGRLIGLCPGGSSAVTTLSTQQVGRASPEQDRTWSLELSVLGGQTGQI